eukprot:gene41321-51161_t
MTFSRRQVLQSAGASAFLASLGQSAFAQGIKNATHSEWFAFFLPAKASPDLVNRLNASMKSALAQKDVIDGLSGFGLEAMTSTPAELTELIKRDTAKWAPIVKQALRASPSRGRHQRPGKAGSAVIAGK